MEGEKGEFCFGWIGSLGEKGEGFGRGKGGIMKKEENKRNTQGERRKMLEYDYSKRRA